MLVPFLIVAIAANPETPKNHIDLAWHDITSAKFAEDASIFPDIRYLSLYNIAVDDREDYIKVLQFALNSLSTNRRIHAFDIVEGSNNGLLRFRLSQLGIKRAVYEEFEDNPYFNSKKRGKEDTFRRLMEINQSHTPILRADWFICKAFTSPVYYKLLGAEQPGAIQKNPRQRRGSRQEIACRASRGHLQKPGSPRPPHHHSLSHSDRLHVGCH